MNVKIKKLKEERVKNCNKISALTTRNEEIDREVTKLENLDIIGLVRSLGLSPDQLAMILHGPPAKVPVMTDEQGENNHAES